MVSWMFVSIVRGVIEPLIHERDDLLLCCSLFSQANHQVIEHP